MAAMPTPETNGKAHLRLLPTAAPSTPHFSTIILRQPEAEDLLLLLEVTLPALITQAIDEVASYHSSNGLSTLEHVLRNVTLAATVRARLAAATRWSQPPVDAFNPGPDPEPGEETVEIDEPF